MSSRTFSPQHIIDLREIAGLSRDDLADAAGFSYWAVKSWERGTREPGASALAGIADALGCAIDDLFEEVQS